MSRTLLARLAVAGAAIAVAAVALRKVTHPAFDEAAFLGGCARACEAQWRRAAADPAQPAYGMKEPDVKALCACNCKALLDGMSPALRADLAARTATATASDATRSQLDALAAEAMTRCVPRFLPPAAPPPQATPGAPR